MKLIKELYEWVHSISIAFVIAFLINMFMFQPTTVLGNSMYPTLAEKDYIGLSRVAHTLRQEPQYGDVVVIDSRVHRPRTWRDDAQYSLNAYLGIFSSTAEPSHDYWIKRVIGKPGDVLEFDQGRVIRNGSVLSEPYVKEDMRYKSADKIVVPAGHIFVLGDNRNYSSDSRYIGPVPIDHVLGKMFFKL